MQRAPTSCSTPRGVAANRATLRVATATPHSPPPIRRHSSLARPPRTANASPSPRTAIPFGIALFALDLSSSPPAESSNELRRVAVRRSEWRRTARLCEPQEQRLFLSSSRGSKPAGPKATSVAGLRGGRLRPATLRVAKAKPSSPPIRPRRGRRLKEPQEHRQRPPYSPPQFCKIRPRHAPFCEVRSRPQPAENEYEA